MTWEQVERSLPEQEPKVRTYFRRRCVNDEEVDDLAQEAMLAAVDGFARFEGRSSFMTWRYGIWSSPVLVDR